MIPKIIHYGCFGQWNFSDKEKECIASWKKILPDYSFREWNDYNGPREKRFFREAVALKPVNASNYLRYWALHEFGGIYLDNDVEVLRPFDLTPKCFVGFQRDDSEQDCINTAVLGSEPGHALIAKCIARLDTDLGGTWPVWAPCGLITEELRFAGMTGLNVEQTVGDVTVYAKDRFYPWRWDEPEDMSRVTDRTFAIHRWGGSWNR